MEREVSVIARKLETYFEDSQPEEVSSAQEQGILKTLAGVILMAVAVLLTKISLVLTRWAKRLEN